MDNLSSPVFYDSADTICFDIWNQVICTVSCVWLFLPHRVGFYITFQWIFATTIPETGKKIWEKFIQSIFKKW